MILPEVGTTGRYKLKGKLTNLLEPNRSYECIAVRKIRELEMLGVNILEEFYLPIKLTQEDLNEDIRKDASIVSLKTSNGTVTRFPNTYLTHYPSMQGIKYSVVGLGVNIGALPTSFDLSDIQQEIKELVLNRLGLRAQIRVLTLSPEEYLNHEDHQRVEQDRLSKVRVKSNVQLALEQEQEKNLKLSQYVRELETYIKNLNP